MKKKFFLILAILWTVFIFSNSLDNKDETLKASGFFVDMAMRMLSFVGLGDIDIDTLTMIIRKTAHFTEFFIQSIFVSLFAVCITKKYSRAIVYVLFCGLFTACCDELIQAFVDGRGSAVKDVFIDFGGTVCAVGIFAICRCFFTKRSLLN